jgi:hypothetical protein
LPVDLPPEIRAELAAANAQRHDWIKHMGRPNQAETHGSYQRIADLWVSTTDPSLPASPLRPSDMICTSSSGTPNASGIERHRTSLRVSSACDAAPLLALIASAGCPARIERGSTAS